MLNTDKRKSVRNCSLWMMLEIWWVSELSTLQFQILFRIFIPYPDRFRNINSRKEFDFSVFPSTKFLYLDTDRNVFISKDFCAPDICESNLDITKDNLYIFHVYLSASIRFLLSNFDHQIKVSDALHCHSFILRLRVHPSHFQEASFSCISRHDCSYSFIQCFWFLFMVSQRTDVRNVLDNGKYHLHIFIRKTKL